MLAHRLVARINEGGESASHAGTWFGQGVDDNVTTFPRLAAYFALEARDARGSITVFALSKRDAALRDLDLASRSADNCNDGYVRRGGACILL